jgi:CheY-like chemotaxis protein
MTADEAAPIAILISRDLFFTSKVTGTAQELGYRVLVNGDVCEAVANAIALRCRSLFLDLSMPGLKVEEVIGALPTTDRPKVIAFGAHVQTDRLQAAREAGCDEVMPRSKFSATLPEILIRHAGAQ